ncbi:MAG: ATP-binding cassette domain-containing protein, partial [Chloroflexota bacterium]
MLQTNRISKSYGINLILSEISLAIDPADRVGLVGVNGCGKSTLMEIITGRLAPDSGSIAIEKGIRLGYLPQDMLAEREKTIHQLMESKIPGLTEARSNLESLAARLPEGNDSVLQAYGSAQTLYENLGAYETEHRAEEILAGLGLENLSLETPLGELSGGQLTRVHLAGILLAEPDVLLLDEPTNHLDIDSLEWLEGFLSSYRGAVMIVSHDRVFLDNCVKRIL